jgi:hypothetical protein
MILEDGMVPDDPEVEWVKVPIPANRSPVITTLSEDIILVKFHNKDDGVLVVFPHNKKRKARAFKLHDLPASNNSRELLHAIFAILLDFDSGRLSNRNRNLGLLAIRPLLPDVVKGFIGKESRDALRFYLHKDKLSVLNGKQVIFRLDRYILLSSNIKDSIS